MAFRPHTDQHSAVFFHIVGHFSRTKRAGRIEEREEDNQHCVQGVIPKAERIQQGIDRRFQPWPWNDETSTTYRAASEWNWRNDRDHTGLVHAGAGSALAADDALDLSRILHGNTPLSGGDYNCRRHDNTIIAASTSAYHGYLPRTHQAEQIL